MRKEPPEGQAGSREGRRWACGSARESKRPYRVEEWVRVCQARGVVVLERASGQGQRHRALKVRASG